MRQIDTRSRLLHQPTFVFDFDLLDLEVRVTLVGRGKPRSVLPSGTHRKPDRSPTIRPLRLLVGFAI